MSYVDQGMTRGRVYAIIAVAVLHALLAYAVVTGLAYNFMKKAAEDLKTFDVQEEPPPPPEPPPPEQPQVQPPPIVSPPPLVNIQTPAPPIMAVPSAPPFVPTPTAPPAPPAPPAAPPPPRRVEPAHARANLASYISDSDYPASAIRAEQQGTTGFRLTIGPDGRVTACSVTSSSGSSALDDAVCRIMRSRARFTPARDDTGNPTTDSVSSRIRWVLPAN